jgi:hypothetical protein
VTRSHFDGSANPADTSDDHVAEGDEPAGRDVANEPAERDEAGEPDEPTEPDDPATAPDADPRVRDAVRRLDDLSDLPPAEHVEVYEAVHSSLQESLVAASRQADESPPDGSSPS